MGRAHEANLAHGHLGPDQAGGRRPTGWQPARGGGRKADSGQTTTHWNLQRRILLIWSTKT